MPNSIEPGILIGLHKPSTFGADTIRMLLMSLGLTMLQIVAAWAPWRVTIQLEVSVSDANLLSHDSVSRCVLSFIVEDRSLLKVAINMRLRCCLDLWVNQVNVRITVGAKSGWCPWDIHDCSG